MIHLEQVVKSYDQQVNIVDNLDLRIHKGEFVVLVGESGCGKTTTMKMINRLIEPTRGKVLINGEDISRVDGNELRRNIGYVIQNVGLLPHLSIEKNIATVPLLCGKDEVEVNKKVAELLEMIELPAEEYAQRYPRELSGGQQQRVGVARALANDPDIILMDEPFSALDPLTREQLQDELLKLQDELHKTIVFVTHDIDEALKLGDRIAVMQGGKILQYAEPEELLKNPLNEFVENFVGKDRLWKTPDMLKAEDIMSRRVVKIAPNRSVVYAIELMKEHGVRELLVVEGSRLLGVVGSNRIKGTGDTRIKMRDIMKVDIVKVPRDMCLVEVLNIRKERKVAYISVLDEQEKIVGIITDTSILNVLTDIVPEMEEY